MNIRNKRIFQRNRRPIEKKRREFANEQFRESSRPFGTRVKINRYLTIALEGFTNLFVKC